MWAVSDRVGTSNLEFIGIQTFMEESHVSSADIAMQVTASAFLLKLSIMTSS